MLSVCLDCIKHAGVHTQHVDWSLAGLLLNLVRRKCSCSVTLVFVMSIMRRR